MKVSEISKQTGLSRQRIYQIRNELETEQETEVDSPPENPPVPIDNPESNHQSDNLNQNWIDEQLQEAMQIVMTNLREGTKTDPTTIDCILAIAEMVAILNGQTNESRTPMGEGTDSRENVGGASANRPSIMQRLAKESGNS